MTDFRWVRSKIFLAHCITIITILMFSIYSSSKAKISTQIMCVVVRQRNSWNNLKLLVFSQKTLPLAIQHNFHIPSKKDSA